MNRLLQRGRRTALCALLIAGVALGPVAAQAQTAASAPADPTFAVPVTKLLAIGSFTAAARPDVWKPIVPAEMQQTALLYLAGKIDQWYVKPDQSGVVFILNVTDLPEAKAMLDQLPLGKAGLMTFQYIPLGPLSPLRTLLVSPSK